ncbi:MAG TPA: DUF2975 domain-containing protein [Terriglobia bacterium]|nr:DUF2975 domain-containing protein [Terriglobia bacterium]
MTTLREFLTGTYPRNSRLARWDRRVLMGVMNVALALTLVAFLVDALDVHFTWHVTNKEPLRVTFAHERWATLTMNPDVVAPELKARLPDGLEPWSLSVTGKIRNPDRTVKILGVLSTVPMDMLVLSVIWLLRSIVQTTAGTDASEGDPFVRSNVWRLRVIAGILVAAPVIDGGAEIIRSELISRVFPNLPVETTMLEFDVSFMFICFGMGILTMVLAEVFKIGVRLREDTEGLV